MIIGAWAGRKVKSAEGFFVAGRKLGAGLLFTTLIAANLGAGSTVGVTALAYTHGISAWWWIGSAGVGSIILAFWVGPKIWRIFFNTQRLFRLEIQRGLSRLFVGHDVDRHARVILGAVIRRRVDT